MLLWVTFVVVTGGAWLDCGVSGRESRKEPSLHPVPLGGNLLNGAPQGPYQNRQQELQYTPESHPEDQDIVIDYDYFMYGLEKAGVSLKPQESSTEDKTKKDYSSSLEDERDTKITNDFFGGKPDDKRNHATYIDGSLRDRPGNNRNEQEYSTFLRDTNRETTHHFSNSRNQFNNQYSRDEPYTFNNRNTEFDSHNNRNSGSNPLNNRNTGLNPLNNRNSGSNSLNNRNTGSNSPNNRNSGSNSLNNRNSGSNSPNNRNSGSNSLNNRNTGSNSHNNRNSGSNSHNNRNSGSNSLNNRNSGSNPLNNRNTGSNPLNNRNRGPDTNPFNNRNTEFDHLNNRNRKPDPHNNRHTVFDPINHRNRRPNPSNNRNTEFNPINNRNSGSDPLRNRNTGYNSGHDQKYEGSAFQDPSPVFYDTRITPGNAFKYPPPSSPPEIVTKSPHQIPHPSIPQQLPQTIPRNASQNYPHRSQVDNVMSTAPIQHLARPSPAKRFQWHKHAMVSILERFGLSKNFTSNVFDKEERLLNLITLIMHNEAQHGALRGDIQRDIHNLISELGVADMVSEFNVTGIVSKMKFSELLPDFNISEITSNKNVSDLLSNITLGNVRSELSHVFSKLKFPGILSKLKLTDMISKLDIGELISGMENTDITKLDITKLNLTNIISKLDADQLISMFNLGELASKLNLAGDDASKFLKLVLSLDKSLLIDSMQKVDFSKFKDFFSKIKIDSSYLKGIFGREGAAAQYLPTDGDNDSKLLYLPIVDAINVNAIQSLGFLLLLLFVLVTALAYTRSDPYAVSRGSVQKRPGEQYVNHDETLDWGNTDLITVLEAIEEKHNRDDPQEVKPGKPIPRPMPWNPHIPSPQALTSVQWSDRPPVHEEVHLAGPPKFRSRPKQRLPAPRPTLRTKPLKPLIHQRSKHRPVTQNTQAPKLTKLPLQPQSFRPPHRSDAYDRHRHFDSYEDEYEYRDYDYVESSRPYDRTMEVSDDHYQSSNNGPYVDDYNFKGDLMFYDRSMEASDTRYGGSRNRLRTTKSPLEEHDFYTFYRPPSPVTTWRPRRMTTTRRPTTFRRTTTASTTTPQPQTRPTSKYALTVRSSLMKYTRKRPDNNQDTE